MGAHTKKVEQVLKEQSVTIGDGLRDAEVLKRRNEYGSNNLEAKKQVSPLALFFSQFKDVLIIILIIAATISLAISLFGSGTSEVIHDSTEKEAYYDAEYGLTEKEKLCKALIPECGYYDDLQDPVVTHKEAPTEAFLIYAIVVAIAIVGFLNEYKAEKTVEALRKLVGQNATVRRNGEVIEIPASDLVPGDIVLLDEGKKIPADLRLVETKAFRINEASLTGESEAVGKNTDVVTSDASLGDQKNMAFSGTFVVSGTAIGVVVGTGSNTEIGKIATLVNDVEDDETPMQKKLDALGKQLGFAVILVSIVVFVVIFFFNKELINQTFLQRALFAFTAAVALAVAAIPEGLAFVVRISLALGARRMAVKNALVRKLSAVEALGSTDVICSDKTGTLTKGEMTVRKIWLATTEFVVDGSGYENNGNITNTSKNPTQGDDDALGKLLTIGTLCNNSQLKNGAISGDPTEAALLVAALKHKISKETLQVAHQRIDEVPFSSDRKKMTTVHKDGKSYIVMTKGAVESVLESCSSIYKNGRKIKLSPEMKKEILTANDRLASEALRVLAFAYKESSKKPNEKSAETDLVFVGLQGMMDPPRLEVKEVIQTVQSEAGMRVAMITGDHIQTAQAVAAEIGILGGAISGADIDRLTQAEFEKKVESISVFARVNPEHKIRIVQALKKNGHQVAMTGDGVNDAPAIKAADIGIAMGITGTDAAKEAADMILLDDKFLTIISAIEEGRGIFDNVRKFVNYLLSANIAEVITVFLGVIFFQNLVLTAAQLLFINIVTDGLPAVALGSDPSEKGIMRFKPHHFQGNILNKRIWAEMFIFGFAMSAILLYQYYTAESQIMAVSAVFTGMVIFELVRLIDIRTDYKIKWFSNPWLSVAIAGSIVIQLAVLYVTPLADLFGVVPIDARNWMIIGLGSVALFVLMKVMNPILDLWMPETH